MLDNLGDVRDSLQVHPLVFFITPKSSLEWQLKAEAQEKKKADLKMDLHLKRLCFHQPGSKQCQKKSSDKRFSGRLAEGEGNTQNLKITFWVFPIFTVSSIYKSPQASLTPPYF